MYFLKIREPEEAPVVQDKLMGQLAVCLNYFLKQMLIWILVPEVEYGCNKYTNVGLALELDIE